METGVVNGCGAIPALDRAVFIDEVSASLARV